MIQVCYLLRKMVDLFYQQHTPNLKGNTMIRCDESNGTYNCHHRMNHKGLHECYFSSAGVRKLAVWKTRWSEVLTRTLVKKDFQLKA